MCKILLFLFVSCFYCWAVQTCLMALKDVVWHTATVATFHVPSCLFLTFLSFLWHLSYPPLREGFRRNTCFCMSTNRVSGKVPCLTGRKGKKTCTCADGVTLFCHWICTIHEHVVIGNPKQGSTDQASDLQSVCVCWSLHNHKPVTVLESQKVFNGFMFVF